VELVEFREDFRHEIATRASADSNFTHSAFVDVAVESLEESGELADTETCYFRGSIGRKSIGVDAYAFDHADNSARFVIAEFFDSDEETLSQTQAKTYFTRIRQFVEAALNGSFTETLEDSSPVRYLIEDLQDKREDIVRIRLYLVSDALLSQRVKDWPEGSIGTIPVEYHIWDVSRFHRMRTSAIGQDELIVDFDEDSSGGLPCLPASVSDAYSSYLCVVRGKTLAEIYNKYGSRLLEGNVRSFLSTTGKVNKAIRKTIIENPAMFFAFNNGIAATATDVTLDDSGAHILTATDLQIVNGGQTTASLAAALRSLRSISDDIYVPMKLSVVEPQLAEVLIPDISRCANSQNKVSEADFFSNSPFHRKLEQISRRLWAPASDGAQYETHWFYERARGQYVNEILNLSVVAKTKFKQVNPRQQVITKTDLAKSETAWFGSPDRVSRGAQSAFLNFAVMITKDWERDPDQYNDDYFKSIVARTILFRETQSVVQSQDWYAGGYRANIVAYAIAKLAHDISRLGTETLDVHQIWNQQRLSIACRKQVAVTAFAVFKVITNPPANSSNVTQWCKKEDCWSRIKDLSITLLQTFTDELLNETQRQAQNRTKTVLKGGADAQAAVVALGADYWRELLTWGLVRGLVDPSGRVILSLARGLNNKRLPSDKQSIRMLELKHQLENQGFS